MEFKAVRFLLWAVFLTRFLTSVSCDVAHPLSAGNDTTVTLASTAGPTMNTSPQSVTPVHTSTAGATESHPSPTGTSGPQAHTCAEVAFHAGSFVGGVVLIVGLMLLALLGHKLLCSRPEVRYSALQVEHEAII